VNQRGRGGFAVASGDADCFAAISFPKQIHFTGDGDARVAGHLEISARFGNGGTGDDQVGFAEIDIVMTAEFLNHIGVIGNLHKRFS